MTHWRDPEPPDWSSFAPKLRQLWHNPKWSSSIYVDDASLAPSAQGAPSTGLLHSHLQRTSARACSICDPQAHQPFHSNVALSKHVSMQHHQHVCPVCLNVSVGRVCPSSVVLPEQASMQYHCVYALLARIVAHLYGCVMVWPCQSMYWRSIIDTLQNIMHGNVDPLYN